MANVVYSIVHFRRQGLCIKYSQEKEEFFSFKVPEILKVPPNIALRIIS